MHQAIKLLVKIPRGRVATYKEVARVCGASPRAIGSLMAHNRDPVGFPCYKVILSDGNLGGYSGRGGVSGKRKMLERDGIKLINGKVDKRYFFHFS